MHRDVHDAIVAAESASAQLRSATDTSALRDVRRRTPDRAPRPERTILRGCYSGPKMVKAPLNRSKSGSKSGPTMYLISSWLRSCRCS